MIVETPRLVLREFARGDAQYLSPILANPQVMRFSTSGCLTQEQTQEKIDIFTISYKTYGFGKWAVFLKETNQLIGYCGIAVEEIDGKQETELGYRLSEKYWGQGLATEAAKATLDYGLNQLKLPYILAVVEPANIASVRVIEKLGMEYQRQTLFYGLDMSIYQASKKR